MYNQEQNGGTTTQALTDQPQGQPKPPEIFMLFSRTLPLIHREYIFQGDAQRDAELIARSNRGHAVCIVQVVASVVEPLPDLQWTDGRPAGDGREHSQVMGAASPRGLDTPRPQTYQEHYGKVERSMR